MPRGGANTFMLAGYGEEADRARLLLVANAEGVTQSQWIVNMIRKSFTELYGPDADPQQLVLTSDVQRSLRGSFSTRTTITGGLDAVVQPAVADQP